MVVLFSHPKRYGEFGLKINQTDRGCEFSVTSKDFKMIWGRGDTVGCSRSTRENIKRL